MSRSVWFVGTVLAVTLAIPVLSSEAQPAQARSHPDFSGDWVLDLERSRLAKHFEGIASGRIRIEHKHPAFSFSRTFVERNGKSSSVAFTLATDGREVAGEADGMQTRQTLTWSGEALLFLTIFRAPLGEARNTVRYSLRDDGRTLQAEESFVGPRVSYVNLWVFVKKY